MKLNRTLLKAVATVVTLAFFSQDIAFAMAPGMLSEGASQLRPGAEEKRSDVVNALNHALAMKKGDGSGIKYTNIPDEFDGKEVKIGWATPVKADWKNPPTKWKNYPILGILAGGKMEDIVKAFEYFRDNEARIPKDKLKIQLGYWPVDEKSGKLPMPRLEHYKDDSWGLAIHIKYAKIMEDLLANDIWLKVDLTGPSGKKEQRIASVAAGAFEWVAKHEMNDLIKALTYTKGTGYAGHIDAGLGVNRNEIAANGYSGQYALINNAIKLCFVGSYCFGNATRYHNSILGRRINWFFSRDGKDKENESEFLWNEFPYLDKSLILRKQASRIARIINREYFSRRDRRNGGLKEALELTDIKVPQQYLDEWKARELTIMEVLPTTGADPDKAGQSLSLVESAKAIVNMTSGYMSFERFAEYASQQPANACREAADNLEAWWLREMDGKQPSVENGPKGGILTYLVKLLRAAGATEVEPAMETHSDGVEKVLTPVSANYRLDPVESPQDVSRMMVNSTASGILNYYYFEAILAGIMKYWTTDEPRANSMLYAVYSSGARAAFARFLHERWLNCRGDLDRKRGQSMRTYMACLSTMRSSLFDKNFMENAGKGKVLPRTVPKPNDAAQPISADTKANAAAYVDRMIKELTLHQLWAIYDCFRAFSENKDAYEKVTAGDRYRGMRILNSWLPTDGELVNVITNGGGIARIYEALKTSASRAPQTVPDTASGAEAQGSLRSGRAGVEASGQEVITAELVTALLSNNSTGSARVLAELKAEAFKNDFEPKILMAVVMSPNYRTFSSYIEKERSRNPKEHALFAGIRYVLTAAQLAKEFEDVELVRLKILYETPARDIGNFLNTPEYGSVVGKLASMLNINGLFEKKGWFENKNPLPKIDRIGGVGVFEQARTIRRKNPTVGPNRTNIGSVVTVQSALKSKFPEVTQGTSVSSALSYTKALAVPASTTAATVVPMPDQTERKIDPRIAPAVDRIIDAVRIKRLNIVRKTLTPYELTQAATSVHIVVVNNMGKEIHFTVSITLKVKPFEAQISVAHNQRSLYRGKVTVAEDIITLPRLVEQALSSKEVSALLDEGTPRPPVGAAVPLNSGVEPKDSMDGMDKDVSDMPALDVIEYTISTLPNYGPGSEERLADDEYIAGIRTTLWEATAQLDNVRIEILTSNNTNLTPQVDAELKSVNERRKSDIFVTPFQNINGEKGLEKLLENKPAGVLRMIVTEPSSNDELIALAQKRPELFRNVRVISAQKPDNYRNMHSNDKSLYLVRMLSRAIYARILQPENKTPAVEIILEEMFFFDLGDKQKAKDLIKSLPESDFENNDPAALITRLKDCTSKILLLSQRIGRELRLREAIWTAA